MRTMAELPAELAELVAAGRSAWQAQRYREAEEIFLRSLAIARRDGNVFAEYVSLHFLGNIALNECRDEESSLLHEEALGLAESAGDAHGVATSYGSIALVDVARGDLDAARRNYEAGIAAYEEAGMTSAADTLRGSISAFVEERRPLASAVHRQPRHG